MFLLKQTNKSYRSHVWRNFFPREDAAIATHGDPQESNVHVVRPMRYLRQAQWSTTHDTSTCTQHTHTALAIQQHAIRLAQILDQISLRISHARSEIIHHSLSRAAVDFKANQIMAQARNICLTVSQREDGNVGHPPQSKQHTTQTAAFLRERQTGIQHPASVSFIHG